MDKRFSRKFFDKANILFIIVIALLLLFSFALPSAEKRVGLSVDMSGGKIYTLTTDTKKSLATLETEINIYPLHFPGNEFSTTVEIARKFANENAHIHLREYTDHIGMQVTVADASIPLNKAGLLITNEDFSISKFIPESELYAVEANQTLVKTESKILSSINDIARGASAKIRLLSGHNEASVSEMSSFIQLLQQKNYEVDIYNFGESPAKLDPKTDLLLVIAPKKDLTEAEYSTVTSFLSQGGRIMFFMENIIYNRMENEYFAYVAGLEYFDMLFESYGIDFKENIVLSNDPEYINLRPTSLLVLPDNHVLTKQLLENDERVLVNESSSITLFSVPGVTNTPVLHTDPSCYAKALISGSMIFAPAAEDETGSFVIATLAEKKGGGNIMLFASASLLQDGAFSVTGNHSLLEACINYMTPLQTTTAVEGKPLNPTVKTANSFITVALSAVFIVLLPLYFLYLGITKHMKYRLHS